MQSNMKEVIEIESDSVDQLSLSYDYPLGQRDKVVRLVQESNQEGWILDSKLIKFSEYLQIMAIQNEDEKVLFTVNLPQNLPVQKQYIQTIELFYLKHHFDAESIILKKITIQGFQKGLDPISLSFVQEHLQTKSDKDLRRLLNLCQYLKFNHLKELISIFIASQHFFFYNSSHMNLKIIQNEAYYSRQEQINIKLKFKPYAQQVSKDLLVKLSQKYQNQYKQHEP